MNQKKKTALLGGEKCGNLTKQRSHHFHGDRDTDRERNSVSFPASDVHQLELFFPFYPLFSSTAMAPSPSLLSILFFFFVLVSFFSPLSHAAKLPFHPEDLLPLLPRQVSWPILNSLHSPVDLLPSFVGAASSQNDTVEWKGACFYNNTAWMEFHNSSGSEFGGGTLHIEVSVLNLTHFW